MPTPIAIAAIVSITAVLCVLAWKQPVPKFAAVAVYAGALAFIVGAFSPVAGAVIGAAAALLLLYAQII